MNMHTQQYIQFFSNSYFIDTEMSATEGQMMLVSFPSSLFKAVITNIRSAKSIVIICHICVNSHKHTEKDF